MKKLTILAFFSLFCTFANAQSKEDLRKEFERVFKETDPIKIQIIRNPFSSTKIKVSNFSNYKVEELFVYLNPPGYNKVDGFMDILKEIGKSMYEGSFRAGDIFLDSKKYQEIPLNEFTHTDSGERFSEEKYKMKIIAISAKVRYKGQLFTHKGAWKF